MQFEGTDLGNVIPPERVICQDEMVESVDAEAFEQRLWGMLGRDGARYRPGDGSPAGAARQEHGGGREQVNGVGGGAFVGNVPHPPVLDSP